MSETVQSRWKVGGTEYEYTSSCLLPAYPRLCCRHFPVTYVGGIPRGLLAIIGLQILLKVGQHPGPWVSSSSGCHAHKSLTLSTVSLLEHRYTETLCPRSTVPAKRSAPIRYRSAASPQLAQDKTCGNYRT